MVLSFLIFSRQELSNSFPVSSERVGRAADEGGLRKCLVTGASGFIGSALVRALIVDRDVRIALRPSTNASVARIAEVVQIPDIGPVTDWREALGGVGTVIHLAGRAHVLRETWKHPLSEYRRVNVQGAIQLARQAAEARVGRFIFVSSIGVNGDETTSTPFSETDVPNPQGPYAISKWEAEQELAKLALHTGMELVIIRPPMVYGMNAPGNFDRIRRLVSSGFPLPFRAVRNRRSFVGLDNLIDLIITCLEHPAAANETFLVSDNDDISTTELIRNMAHAMGRPARLIAMPVGLLTAGARLLGRGDEAKRLLSSLQVDCSKARQLLGWEPRVSIGEGLARAVAVH